MARHWHKNYGSSNRPFQNDLLVWPELFSSSLRGLSSTWWCLQRTPWVRPWPSGWSRRGWGCRRAGWEPCDRRPCWRRSSIRTTSSVWKLMKIKITEVRTSTNLDQTTGLHRDTTNYSMVARGNKSYQVIIEGFSCCSQGKGVMSLFHY